MYKNCGSNKYHNLNKTEDHARLSIEVVRSTEPYEGSANLTLLLALVPGRSCRVAAGFYCQKPSTGTFGLGLGCIRPIAICGTGEGWQST